MATLTSVVAEGLKSGVNATGNKIGIYCERPKRLSSVLTYIPHTCFDTNFGLLSGCVLELLVDRARGGTIHNRRYQREPESVLITGVYVHVWSIAHCNQKGFLGWLKVHLSAFERLRHSYCDTDASDSQ